MRIPVRAGLQHLPDRYPFALANCPGLVITNASHLPGRDGDARLKRLLDGMIRQRSLRGCILHERTHKNRSRNKRRRVGHFSMIATWDTEPLSHTSTVRVVLAAFPGVELFCVIPALLSLDLLGSRHLAPGLAG